MWVLGKLKAGAQNVILIRMVPMCGNTWPPVGGNVEEGSGGMALL